MSAFFAAFIICSCGAETQTPVVPGERNENNLCPATAIAPDPLPRVRREQQQANYWTSILSQQVKNIDQSILSQDEVKQLNRNIINSPHQFDLLSSIDEQDMNARILERFSQIKRRTESHELFDGQGMVLDNLFSRNFQSWVDLPYQPKLYISPGSLHLHCTPTQNPYYYSATDRRFDRNQCSGVDAGEPIQVLKEDSQFKLIRTRYSFGFVESSTVLGSPIRAESVRSRLDAQVIPALTRRAVIEKAFSYLGRPYGWGGQDGGFDCSDFLLHVFAYFGLNIPRHSADQAESGSYQIDIPESMNEQQRLTLIDQANRNALVLLHFPGHIMLYLGRNNEGLPMAIHSFAEYVEPCETPAPDGRHETLRYAPGVAVTDLELGRGTSRRAFIERITSLTVIGQADESMLQYISGSQEAMPVVAGACGDEDNPAIIRSPRRPYSGGEVKIFYVEENDPGSVSIAMISDDGRRVELQVDKTGGPPWGIIAHLERVEAGTWTIFVGNGSNQRACEKITIESSRSPYVRPVTSAFNRWDASMEALYSIFVEKLFDYPIDERTWPSLHILLQNKENNILYDHFTANEESRLRLTPDCADLPTFLRAYFSWKMGVPYGYRYCSRGRQGSPPSCGSLESNLSFEPTSLNPIDGFLEFINGPVRAAIHSSSARTPPRLSETDWYPVELTREGLRPGTVYADPYGHVMTIVKWVAPQNGHEGMLIAADAQPDATIGRPRFWQGTFLFVNDAQNVGAGFKAFRPVMRTGGESVHALTNAELTNSRDFRSYSTMQYQGSVESFYDRVEALIEPEQRNPVEKLITLINAFEDSVRRRVVSVDNAEAWRRNHLSTIIGMPQGSEIFLTSGAWEDYSTPSRDLRLLIALDTVVNFTRRVERQPQRFGIAQSQIAQTVAMLNNKLDQELHARSFVYHGTNGVENTLTLFDVRSRVRAFEVAYNPNDCPEVRWGAPEGSEERSRCHQRAPSSQQDLMARYRVWFAERRRPAL